MIQIATSVIISLLLTSVLLRFHENKMQERFLDVYEKLLRISQIIRQTNLSKTFSESSDPAKTRN